MLNWRDMSERAWRFWFAFLHNDFKCGINANLLSIVTPAIYLAAIIIVSIFMVKSLLWSPKIINGICLHLTS